MTKLVNGPQDPCCLHRESQHQLSNHSEVSVTEQEGFGKSAILDGIKFVLYLQSVGLTSPSGKEISEKKKCFH